MSDAVQWGSSASCRCLAISCRADSALTSLKPWDQWLQQAMHMALAQVGWNELYAQCRAVALRAGSGLFCGGSPVVGVLVPSNDRVGRRSL